MAGNIDILILTSKFGLGHISVAKGIKEHILDMDSSINIEIVDVFQVLIPKLSKNMYKFYIDLVKKSPEIYNHFYYKKSQNEHLYTDKFFYKYNLNRLKKYLLDVKPKMVISTFPTASHYISNLKEKDFFSMPLITCITDVVHGWEWIAPNCSKYFVATEYVKNKMIEKGIEKQKIIVTGIPLRKEFLIKEKSIPSLNLPKDHLIIMVMGGGVGLLPEDEEFYRRFNEFGKVTTIVLTGKNRELLAKLLDMNMERVIPIGYTDEVASLMAQSDILVTKPGGITVFEAIASELPLVVYNPKLGQELENAKFIAKKSIGIIALDMDSLYSIIKDLVDNTQEIGRYKKNMAALKQKINMRVLGEEAIKLLHK
jgi:processive 1,2-diacylglycerol beta-glucosyltransferase